MPSKRHFDKPFQLFHLSEQDHDGEVFEPRPLDKLRAMEGEDWKIPRTCVSSSIDGAVSSLVDSMSCFTGLQLFVHVPENLDALFAAKQVYRPSTRQVPDAEVTGEHWLKSPAKMKKIGRIEVLGLDYGKQAHYMWKGKVEQMDRFRWKWIEGGLRG